MCIYSSEDIKKAIERADELLHPFLILCHPDNEEQIKTILQEYKEEFSCYSLETCIYVEKNKIYIIDKKNLNVVNVLNEDIKDKKGSN